MTRRVLIAEAILSLFFVSLMLIASGLHLRHLLRHQTQVTVRAMQKSATPLLEKANHAKDDLALQGIVQSLANVPGVATVCVIDHDEKILAGAQPAQIGQRFVHTDSHPLWAAGLHDGATRWGTLILTYSDRPLQKCGRSQMELEGVLAFLGWSLFFIYAFRLQRKTAALRDHMNDLALLQDDHERKLLRVRAQADQQRRLSDERLKRLCETLPLPTTILDQRQWVVAVNPSMLARAAGNASSVWIGRSWQDVPALQPCAPAIERSLQKPTDLLEIDAGSFPGRWRIQALRDDGGTPVGTLMTLIE